MIPIDKLEKFTYNTITSDFSTGKPVVVKSLLKNSIGSGRIVSIKNGEFSEEHAKLVHSKNQESLLKELNFIFENNLLELENPKVFNEIVRLKKYLDKIKVKETKGKKKKK